MRANRGRDTSPERALRSALHSAGWRYRVNLRMTVNGTTVRPDVVFTKRRVALFVDGCFWHGCPTHASWPRRNAEFWRQKIETNRVRDARQTHALENSGWTVVRIWEHESLGDAVARITDVLSQSTT